MFPVMHQYKLRLTNLSQANRSLKLQKLSVRKDLDIVDASFVNGMSAAEILAKIVSGQSVTLMKSLSSRDEATNLLDRRLNNIFHEVSTINEETGTYDLFIGYPFVEGRFLDGSVARCPLVLFPVVLKRDFTGGTRWVLKADTEEDLSFNTTFFLAYEKFMQTRLKREFWDEGPERHEDLQAFLNALYKQLTQHEIALHFNSELFQFRVDAFAEKNAALLDTLPVGVLKLVPHAVMGIFPQSDSALLQDYEVLEREAEQFDLAQFFAPRPKLPEQPAVSEAESFFVSTVDQSQEDALLRVRAGESVVLHGPPGTGKSQVILNLISDALARGKRVLVCSQKRAALDVVFQRMNEVGLGRFAALVHDYRGDRNKIFARIRQQIDDIETFEAEGRSADLDNWMREFNRDTRRIDEQNAFFDQLHESLTGRGHFGLSAHELYLMADPRAPHIDMSAVARDFDYDSWRAFHAQLSAILDYQEFFEELHPWHDRQPMHKLGFAGKAGMQERLTALPAEIERLHGQWLGLQTPHNGIDHPSQIGQLLPAFDRLQEMVNQPGAKGDLAAAIGDNLKPDYLQERLGALGMLFEKMAAFKVLSGFSVERLGELQGHVLAYEAGQGKLSRLVSMSWINAWRYLGKLMGAKGEQLDPEGLKRLKAEAEVLARLQKMHQDQAGQAYFGDMPLTSAAGELIAWQAQKLRNTLLLAEWLTFREWEAFRPRVSNGAFDESYWAVVKGDAVRLREIELSMQRTVQGWQTHFHPTQATRLAQGLIKPAVALEYASLLQASFQKDIDDLIQLDTLLDGLDVEQRSALAHLLPNIAAMDGAPKADLLQQVQNGILLAWLNLIESHRPELLETSSRQMPERLASYAQLVKSRTATVTGLIQRRLKDAIVANISFNRLNNPVTYRDISHQVRKQRQLWPVRKLVQTFWEEGLSRLMPCWMASPESVAAIFPMVNDFFDLVIFDEASQCYVERALPVMLRGKQCVIAGDDQQLPPFDLYNVKAEEETEGAEVEEQMPLEVESILDLSRNIFPQAKLNWHYRSTEQDLINFSNFAFYEGRLSMAPPAQHEEISTPPISFVKVAGVWDRNRNEVEARQVVALIEELVRRPENPTVGVVTFNYFQKELIRELLELRLVELGMAGDKEGAAMLHKAMEREEGEERMGVFIKNIENVQGDERDVIIFSVGYARNAAGKLIANFGLLNQKGGGNRLNVAITRAKKKKIIVCSIDPEELQVDDSKHDGPKLLKRYLQYARALSLGDEGQVKTILAQLRTLGPDKTDTTTTVVPAEGLPARLKADLEARGWRVETGLGDHNFTLDLALLAADGSYVLGLECEGRSYFAGRSAKEREVYRPGLLLSRGWEIYRLWNRNYFLNPAKELDRIVEIAERVRAQRQPGA